MTLVYGVGINDLPNTSTIVVNDEVKASPAYTAWVRMLERCYCPKSLKKQPTYLNCTVCTEWHYFSTFKEWYDQHHVQDFQLDKDLLGSTSKEYSPATCVFIPSKINSLLASKKSKPTKLPLGVEVNGKRYRARIVIDYKKVSLGTFDTPRDAHKAWFDAKVTHARELVSYYFKRGELSFEVCNAIMLKIHSMFEID